MCAWNGGPLNPLPFEPFALPIFIAGGVGIGKWRALRFEHDQFFEDIPHRIANAFQKDNFIAKSEAFGNRKLRFWEFKFLHKQLNKSGVGLVILRRSHHTYLEKFIAFRICVYTVNGIL